MRRLVPLTSSSRVAMTPVLLLVVPLILPSAVAPSQAVTLPEIIGQLSLSCRQGCDNSAVVDDIRAGQDQLEEMIAEIQRQVTSAAAECPYGWSRIENSCYLIPLARASWFRAQHHCAELDPRARLAIVPPSASERLEAMVRASTSSSWGAWIGLVRLESGEFGWTSGSPLVFTDWNEGEPSGDGDCVHYWGPGHGSARGWNDLPCTKPAYILCQIPLH